VRNTVFIVLLFFHPNFVNAQHVSLLIKGGHVIDPKNQIDGIFDVSVSGGKILRVAKTLDRENSEKVIDASGMYVVPGFIDIHTHDFYSPDSTRHYCDGDESVLPDAYSFCSGVTTVVDAGSSGWRDFPVFKKKIIDQSKTRVLALLNIVGAGMRGPRYEQDILDMDGSKTAEVATIYKPFIVGIKLAHFEGPGWKAVNESMIAGNLSHLPVMIDFGESSTPKSIRELFLDHMRPGDIFTHCFAELKGREFIVDTSTKKMKPFVWKARKKGIYFDLGCGAISFSFSQAVPASKQGFYPNSISTDMHAMSNAKIKDMPEIMSEFLAMGMPMREIIKAVTWNPAKEIHHEELGNISAGAIADIAILRITNEKEYVYDHSGNGLNVSAKLKPVITISKGEIVYSSF
jgi:dihydroorotase